MVLASTYGRVGVTLSLLDQRCFMFGVDSIELTRSVCAILIHHGYLIVLSFFFSVSGAFRAYLWFILILIRFQIGLMKEIDGVISAKRIIWLCISTCTLEIYSSFVSRLLLGKVFARTLRMGLIVVQLSYVLLLLLLLQTKLQLLFVLRLG